MGTTVGDVRKMIQDLPENAEFVIEVPSGSQYEPYMCGIARRVFSNGKYHEKTGMYVFDGEVDEAILESYDKACFLFRCA